MTFLNQLEVIQIYTIDNHLVLLLKNGTLKHFNVHIEQGIPHINLISNLPHVRPDTPLGIEEIHACRMHATPGAFYFLTRTRDNKAYWYSTTSAMITPCAFDKPVRNIALLQSSAEAVFLADDGVIYGQGKVDSEGYAKLDFPLNTDIVAMSNGGNSHVVALQKSTTGGYNILTVTNREITTAHIKPSVYSYIYAAADVSYCIDGVGKLHTFHTQDLKANVNPGNKPTVTRAVYHHYDWRSRQFALFMISDSDEVQIHNVWHTHKTYRNPPSTVLKNVKQIGVCNGVTFILKQHGNLFYCKASDSIFSKDNIGQVVEVRGAGVVNYELQHGSQAPMTGVMDVSSAIKTRQGSRLLAQFGAITAAAVMAYFVGLHHGKKTGGGKRLSASKRTHLLLPPLRL